MEGTITRKDIIQDEALNWGSEYAKIMEAAISKNKEFLNGLLAMNDANNPLRNSANQKEYQNRYNLQNSNKVFNLSKEIEYLENKHLFIKYAVEALKFDYNAEVVERIIEYGYRITKEKYLDDLERILRESNAIVNKINLLKNSLPKKTESESKGTEIIVDSMANYSSILGFDFDFYAISVEKFHSLEKQVKNKIAAIEKNNAKNKK